MSICGFTVLVSVVYSLRLPNIYSATAKILPPQKESGGALSALVGQAGGLAGLAASGLGGGDLYLGILKSRSVADGVINKLDLMKVYEVDTLEQARLTLQGRTIVQGGKDGIISITTEDKDPKLSALLANTIVEELGTTTVRLNLSKAGTERAFLEKRLDVVKKDLKIAEENLKTFCSEHKIVQVDSQTKASVESVARMKAELANREIQLSIVRAKQTDESPDIKALQSGIRQLKNEIQRISGSSVSAEGIPSVGSVPSLGLEYTRRLRELKTQEAILEQLTKQYEVAKLGEAKDSSAFQVLDEAVVPIKKSKPSRARIVILATISGGILSVLLAFLLEWIGNLEDAEKELLNRIKREIFSVRS